MPESIRMDDTTTTYSGRLIAMAGVSMIERWGKNFENVRKRKNEKSDKKDILEYYSRTIFHQELASSTPDILKKDQRSYIQVESLKQLKQIYPLRILLSSGEIVEPYCQCLDLRNNRIYICMSKESCKECHEQNWR